MDDAIGAIVTAVGIIGLCLLVGKGCQYMHEYDMKELELAPKNCPQCKCKSILIKR